MCCTSLPIVFWWFWPLLFCQSFAVVISPLIIVFVVATPATQTCSRKANGEALERAPSQSCCLDGYVCYSCIDCSTVSFGLLAAAICPHGRVIMFRLSAKLQPSTKTATKLTVRPLFETAATHSQLSAETLLVSAVVIKSLSSLNHHTSAAPRFAKRQAATKARTPRRSKLGSKHNVYL